MTDRAAPGAPRPLAVRLARPWVVGSLLFICVLSGYLLTFNVDKPTHNADWYIRYQVTCSIVERNQFYIHPYRQDGRDGPGVNGHTYSQYTLGQTTAMIPLYLLGRMLAGVAHTNCDTTIAPPIVFLTAKSLDLIIGALLCLLFFATARLLGFSRIQSLALTLLLAFGTSLWPDALSNLEHTMESLFLLAAAYAALRYTLQRRKSRLWVLVMGVAAGLVFVTRVSGIIAPPIFALYLLVLHRRWSPGAWRRPLLRDLAIFTLGVAPSVVINAVFDLLRFGSPLRTGPYPDQSFGYPPWFGLPNLLISPGKGLIWYTPAIFLLFLVARPFWRRCRLPAILFAIICGVYLLFYANVNYWHGDPAWGPRYLYAILPYLILPLGELWRRWRGYKLPVRGLIVGVLAASFLVQFSAVTVSYWRHWHFIYAYHYDQVENHAWGQNLNYWWAPDQSPIVISLAGIYDITQKYVDHAPLLEHPAEERLSNPYETCIFQVVGQASICITDTEEFNDGANWNTFTPWWAHSYPWWDKHTVNRIALAVLALFLVSGAALLIMLLAARRAGARAAERLIAPPSNGHAPNGHGHDGAALTDLAPLDVTPSSEAGSARAPGHGGTLVTVAMPLAAPARVAAAPLVAAARPALGLAPLGLAALLATLVYGGIVADAALHAPRHAPPLVRTYAMNATISDGTWSYRVLGTRTVPALPGGLTPPQSGHRYAIVRILLSNHTSRPNHVRLEWFDLTDDHGLGYPWVQGLRTQVAALYHLPPFGMSVPAHGSMEGALVFLVRDHAQHFKLLGPGLALVRLNQ